MKSFESKEEAMQYLQSLSIGEIMNIAAEMLVGYAPARKITITEEQFKNFFRISGYTATGEIETRGRKKRD